jgi:hypothetical protein
MALVEEKQEPQVEETPEKDSFYYSISKYAGDYLFPAEFEPTDKLPLSRYNQEGILKDQFFREVRSYFASIQPRPRASRVGQRQGPTYEDRTRPDIPFNEQERPYIEELEKGLILKFAGPEFRDTVYRTKREAERKEDMKKNEGPVGVMTKEQVLKDIADRIGSVQWRPKNDSHKAIVASRPGVSKKYQRELEDESN